ncbi:hypothetical protein NUSPORA_02591 [Nucleospora cyclopteri]
MSFLSDSLLSKQDDAYYITKKFLIHKDADSYEMYTSELHFFKDTKLIIPKEFSFSPGWNKHKLKNRSIKKSKSKQSNLIKICHDYGLTKYFFVVLKIIQMNTYTEKTRKTPLDVCFHLICFHLCTQHNLGKGSTTKVDKKYSCHNLINNKKYCQLFKSKNYWDKKAKILYEQTKIEACSTFGITTSSFRANHLYNVLIILKYNDPKKIALVFYVYYATKDSELNPCYYGLSFSESEKFVSRQKKILIIIRKFRLYFGMVLRGFLKYKVDTT